jgi:hypothetical protein
MLTRELLQSYGWPDNEVTELALGAAAALVRSGLARDAALVWLDQVAAQPTRYLGDPVLAPLARASLRRQVREICCEEPACEHTLQCVARSA